MKEIDLGLSMCGDPNKTAWTRMYMTPDGQLFPVLGEPIDVIVEDSPVWA
jgi:hypothetical protein